MLKDITLGQYFPAESVIHRLDPRTKIIFTFLFMVAVFIANSVISFAFSAVFVLYIIFLSKIKLSYILKSMKPVVFLILFTAVINIFFTGGDDIIFKLSFLQVTKSGLYAALIMAMRVVILITATSLLTYTTSPILLTDGIEKLLEPFNRIGVPSHELAMMMTIALRFIPTLLEETDKIIMAQKARGADFESGNLIRRAKALIPILVPLFISSFRRADELATAMECRCYRGGKNRTRLKELKFTHLDAYALVQMVMFMIILVVMGVLNI